MMTPARPQILTLRNWLSGSWVLAYEQEAAFKALGIDGLRRSNLENDSQIGLTWPNLGIRQTTSGESVPALTPGRVATVAER